MELKWDNELDTGIPEIDSHNRKIVDHLKTLKKAKECDNRAEVGVVLDKLLDYAVDHFLLEEHLMEQANYEFRAAHERIHELFAKKLASFRGRYADGEDVTDDLISMLETWVDVHIREEDHGYAEAVKRTIEQQGGKTWVSSVMNKLFGRPAVRLET